MDVVGFHCNQRRNVLLGLENKMSFIERKPKGVVISLYDFTGEALRPWAEDGYECFAFDIQHDDQGVEYFRGGGSIKYLHADLHNHEDINAIQDKFSGEKVAFGMAFPVCTDMAVSGAAWFEKKRQANPSFQDEAVSYAMWCAKLFNSLHIPFFVENPISVLATRWRKPNYKFHPYEYGGYIPEAEADHPRWPDYIPAQDAYKKATCLWTGNGFKMPEPRAVDPEAYYGNGYSKAMMKLGGKSQRTKDIRSATPRGFARAVFEANNDPRYFTN
jgi:hypothetical protein